MTTILETLRQNLIDYRYEKDTKNTSFVSFLISSIEMVGKNDGNRLTTNDEAVRTLKKLVSNMKDSTAIAESDDGKFQIGFMEALIPAVATESDVDAFLASISYTDIKTAMKAVKEKFGQNVDMKMVSEKIKTSLSV